MVSRYLGVYCPAEPILQDRARRFTKFAAKAFNLYPIVDDQHLLVMANSEITALPIEPNHGAILGTLFGNGSAPNAMDCLDGELSKKVVQTGGECLTKDFWGGYVAFVAEDAQTKRVHVVRDPSGVIPCFWFEQDGVSFFFSDVDIPLSMGLIVGEIDWSFVSHHFAYLGLRTARTGICGVEELLAGTRRSLGPLGALTTCCWTPWQFATVGRQFENRSDVVDLIREETHRCVGAWASRSRSILLELSGGLDSSIVAACLRAARAHFTCVTLATPDPGADERRYARLVAQQIGAPLKAIGLNVHQADLTKSPVIRLPRPGINVLQRILDRALAEEAVSAGGVDSFFAGSGGDNVFCYLDTAAPAADVLRTHGFGRLFLRTVRDLAELHQCTSWSAGRLAVKKAWRAPRKSWSLDRYLLREDNIPSRPQNHPWLNAPADALPGKVEHIASIMALQSTSDGKERNLIGPVRHPLLAQPLVELCLRIPSWMWIDGGRNRAVARDAFAEDLPPEIVNRRTKGNFMGFSGEIFDRNRQVLRELLLDGHLVRHKILDRDAIERRLAAPIQARDKSFFRLFVAADVEVWVASWLNRSSYGFAETDGTL